MSEADLVMLSVTGFVSLVLIAFLVYDISRGVNHYTHGGVLAIVLMCFVPVLNFITLITLFLYLGFTSFGRSRVWAAMERWLEKPTRINLTGKYDD